MPIKGLTDRKQKGGAGLPLIARLHKGGEKFANKPGRDLDHFRVAFEEPFAQYEAQFIEMYGDEPQTFERVFLVAATVDTAFPTWNEEWSAGGLVHRCDGETQVLHREGNQISREPVACAAGCGCKQMGRLTFMLGDFIEATGALGVFQITTHSITDIIKLHTYLQFVENNFGALNGLAFEFGREKRTISMPSYKDASKRTRTTKSLLYLHVEGEQVRELMQLKQANAQAQLASGAAQIAPGEVLDTDTGEILEPDEVIEADDEHDENATWEKARAADLVAQMRDKWQMGNKAIYEALRTGLWRKGAPLAAGTPLTEILRGHTWEDAEDAIKSEFSDRVLSEKKQQDEAKPERVSDEIAEIQVMPSVNDPTSVQLLYQTVHGRTIKDSSSKLTTAGWYTGHDLRQPGVYKRDLGDEIPATLEKRGTKWVLVDVQPHPALEEAVSVPTE